MCKECNDYRPSFLLLNLNKLFKQTEYSSNVNELKIIMRSINKTSAGWIWWTTHAQSRKISIVWKTKWRMSLQNKIKQDYKIANLIKCIKHFKATLEFSKSHADVVRLKSMRVWDKSLYEIFKDNPEFFDSSVIINNNFQGIAKDIDP